MTSTSYPENIQDWRGRFIANLVSGLARRSDLALSLWAPPGESPANVMDVTSPAEKIWLQQMSAHGGIAHLLRHHRFEAASTALKLLRGMGHAYKNRHADVIHVNWLQNALPLLGSNTPAVISVLGTDFGLLRLPGMKSLLRSTFRQRATILAPNADWMEAELRQHFGDVAEIQTIAFGIDEIWYAVERQLNQDSPHNWLAITRLTAKKIGDLFTWGEGKFGDGRVLHLFGPMQEEIDIPPWIKYHGPTHPAELANDWFPRASGLITLSRHDEGRPQVMLEAMAAGLPIIASDLSAHRDIVQHQQTGWLTTSSDDFGLALDHLEKKEVNRLAGQQAREWARKKFGNWDDCAARYATLYRQLLEPQ